MAGLADLVVGLLIALVAVGLVEGVTWLAAWTGCGTVRAIKRVREARMPERLGAVVMVGMTAATVSGATGAAVEGGGSDMMALVGASVQALVSGASVFLTWRIARRQAGREETVALSDREEKTYKRVLEQLDRCEEEREEEREERLELRKRVGELESTVAALIRGRGLR